MTSATFFVRGCPICGRHLQVRVIDLGKEVRCRHCTGEFIATESGKPTPCADTTKQSIMQRVDELLAAAELPARPR
jgi:uncharacterized protein (DUF3084 family)